MNKSIRRSKRDSREYIRIKSKRDSIDDYIISLKQRIASLKRERRELKKQLDHIDEEIYEAQTELEEKEGYASLEERGIEY